MIVNVVNPPPPRDGKVPLILWSGGVDSTALLVKRLAVGQQVDVISMDVGQAERKIQHELVARMLLTKALHQNEHEVIRVAAKKSLTYDRVSTVRPYSQLSQANNTVAFQQLSGWFIGALQTFDPMMHSHIEMAYVLGDDISVHLSNIHHAGLALGMVLKEVPVPIYFPFALTRKERLYQLLQRQLVEAESTTSLLELTWVCELPTGSGHCRHCPACSREEKVRKSLDLPPRKEFALAEPAMSLPQSRWGTYTADYWRDWVYKEIRDNQTEIEGFINVGRSSEFRDAPVGPDSVQLSDPSGLPGSGDAESEARDGAVADDPVAAGT